MENTAVIDLFCGIGGLSQGFVNEGFDVVAGYDNDLSCKYAFEKNNNSVFYHQDVNKLTGKELNSKFGDKLKILVGCAPCQPFSSYSYKIKDKDENKTNLLYAFSQLIEECNPDIISMENVPQLVDFNKFIVFKDFVEKLKSLSYYVDYQVVNCPDYGIPQNRRRLVLLASRYDKISLIEKTHTLNKYVTLQDIIGNLSPVKAGETDKNDILHRARGMNALNLKRIKHSSQGGSWKEWPEELLPSCFKKETGKTYVSVYGRMKWDEPAPTMTTHCTGFGNGRFGHPEQDRAITLREAALIQTFPMDYKFFDDSVGYSQATLCRQIGNAVPPKLGRVIAKSIKKHLEMVKL